MPEVSVKKFSDPTVGSAYLAMPDHLQPLALKLRDLVHEVAEHAGGAGQLVETLKWGEPSYLTQRPSTGSTVRIAPVKGRNNAVGVFFICTSGLIEHFRELYGDVLRFEGNRAIVVEIGGDLPHEALSHCIGLALTRKLWKPERLLS